MSEERKHNRSGVESTPGVGANGGEAPTWLFPGHLDDLTLLQQEALHLAYQCDGWDALLAANGNALRFLVEQGLVRRVLAAHDPVSDRRARAIHDTYERDDRELYWRFALTPQGRAIAEAAWGIRDDKGRCLRRR